MQVTPVSINIHRKQYDSKFEPQFKHIEHSDNYSLKQKTTVAGMSALGVVASMAILAKTKKMNLFTKNIKDSYFLKEKYRDPGSIIGIGAGSILGGLTGGYMIDKDKNNRRAKQRESLMAIGNVAIPILTVDFAVDHLLKDASAWGKAAGGLAGVFAGVTIANVIMNKVCNLIFHNKNERGVKLTDYSAHFDDVVVAANYIVPEENKFMFYVSRLIPIALMIPGNEVGNKTA